MASVFDIVLWFFALGQFCHICVKKIFIKYHQHAIAHLNLAQNAILNTFDEISRKTEEKKVPLFFGLKQYYGCYGNFKKYKKMHFFSQKIPKFFWAY